MYSSLIKNDSFEQWKGNCEILNSVNLDSYDFDPQNKNGFILEAYHGTTRAFDVFNSEKYGHMECHFGKMNYFTTSENDAAMNYCLDGADLSNKIERLAENIISELEWSPETYNISPEEMESMDETGIEKYAYDIAHNKYAGNDNIILELFVKIKKPFLLNSHSSIQIPELELDFEPDFDDDASFDMFYEELDDLYTSLIHDVEQILGFSLGDNPLPNMSGGDFELTTDEFEKNIREHFQYFEHPETGEMITGEIFRGFVQALGYDSIILFNVDERFKFMNLDYGTTHIHTFDTSKGYIKKKYNETYDFNNPSISN